MEILSKFGSKLLALLAGNTNINYGGRNRRGVNNVHTKLKGLRKKNIIGIGCRANILSNAINTASSLMSMYVELITTNIYLYFSRFTVRVASQQFCEDVYVQDKKLLGCLKVR